MNSNGSTKDNNMILHLSVNAAGLVSLWDTPKAAQSQPGESYVPLMLTTGQVEFIKKGQAKAKTAPKKR